MKTWPWALPVWLLQLWNRPSSWARVGWVGSGVGVWGAELVSGNLGLEAQSLGGGVGGGSGCRAPPVSAKTAGPAEPDQAAMTASEAGHHSAPDPATWWSGVVEAGPWEGLPW